MEPPPPPPPSSTGAEKDKGKQKVSNTSQPHSPYNVVPTGDSSYVKAKHVQLIDKEPSKTTSLFRSAVNSIRKQENPPTSPKLQVKHLPAYLAVSSNTSGSSPRDLFEDVAGELEKQLINRKPRKGISLFGSAIKSISKQKKVGDKIPSIDGALKTQPSSPVKYAIDSFYEQAKQAEAHTDLETACYLYYSAIEVDDQYDDAVKDLAFLLQRMGQTKEAIVLIEQHQHLIEQHQDLIDDLLLTLYKESGRIDEYIELLKHKLKLVEEGSAFGGKRTNVARSQGRKFHVSIEQERSRLLGNLAWAYMQQENYHSAEPLYREALSIEPDKNKQCNLAICLMNSESISEAKYLLQAVTPSYEERKMHSSYIKAYDGALKTLSKLGHSDSIEEHL